MNYFSRLGFTRPPHVDMADFLLNLSVAEDTAMPSDEPIRDSDCYENDVERASVPRDREKERDREIDRVKEKEKETERLAMAWRSSQLFRELTDRLSSASSPQPEWMPEQRTAFPATRWFHFRLLLDRQIKLTIRCAHT